MRQIKQGEEKEIFDLDLEMCLLTKTPVNIGIASVHSLSLKEIASISFSLYNVYVKLLTTNSLESIIDQSSKNAIDCKYILNALAIFFKENIIFNKIFFIKEEKPEHVLTKETFEYLQYILKKMNHQKEPEEKPKFGSKKAEEMWLKKQETDKKFEHLIKNKQTIPSIMSGVAWKTGLGLNAVSEMSIYQLYDAFYRSGLVDKYNYTMEGIYHGTINGEKVNQKEIDWSQTIEVNKE